MSASAAVHLCVHGQVQGVFYRASTQTRAEELKLAGWVRNRPDGSVEIHAEGNREALEELIAWCRQGPPMAKVSTLDLEWVESTGFDSFDIR